jgi:DNA-directed RNA polymerase beta subunit
MTGPKKEEPTIPEGVTLRDPSDFKTLRNDIYTQTMDAMQRSFPQSYGGVRMELDGLEYVDPDEYDIPEQKKALMSNRFLGRRLRGNIKLFDEKTGDLLDQKKTTLMRTPYLTNRGTFIHNGNEYISLAQSRLLPGVYTRQQKNGNYETQFNVRPGSGNTFRIHFEPNSAQYRLAVHNSNLHMYSLLKDMGIPDKQLEEMWGADIVEANRSKYDSRVFDKAYERLVPRFMRPPTANREEKVELINQALNRAMIHEKVASRNLPNMFDRTKSASWRQQWEAKETARKVMDQELEKMDFLPDLEIPEVIKSASSEFNPDLSGEEMGESYDQIFSEDTPRLASMEHWPERWFPEGSDPKGWISWYQGYSNGKRTPDDDRQIKRWKSFKQRHGEVFKRKPTPRRAFALKNWAIDPLKLIEQPTRREEVAKAMEEYKQKQELKYHLLKSGAHSVNTAVVMNYLENADEFWTTGDVDTDFERLISYLDR